MIVSFKAICLLLDLERGWFLVRIQLCTKHELENINI
jgi:hypothetical protein